MLANTTRIFVFAWTPFVLHFLLIGCGAEPNLNLVTEQTRPRMGQEFAIKVGQTVNLESADLQLKFVAVTDDSRCPADVNCVWAGKADVALTVVHEKCGSSLTLTTLRSSQASDEGKIGDFRVKLVKLDPYPRSDRKIGASEYVATLTVTKDK